MKPHFEEVQAHYDLSDDFFGTFQDPSRTYSCAYFERDDMTLEEAQMAKIDLALGKLNLQPGMTLLDIGCGWGSVMKRAIEKHDVNVVGLTLSRNQAKFGQELLDAMDTDRTRRVLLHGWEEFDEPVDRIVSLEAIEAFPPDRYEPFFKTCSSIMPADGRMVLQAILGHPLKKWPELGIPVTMTDLRFMRFIAKEIFPGGSVPGEEQIVALADGGRIHRRGQATARRALRAHARPVVLGVGSPPRRGRRRDVGRGLRAVHEVPDRVQRFLQASRQRVGAVHARQGIAAAAQGFGRLRPPRTPAPRCARRTRSSR